MSCSLYDRFDEFSDVNVYAKSRMDIDAKICDIAEIYAEKEKFLKLFGCKVWEDGSHYNEMSTRMKQLVRLHRAAGVHFTPTCFINSIEVISLLNICK